MLRIAGVALLEEGLEITYCRIPRDLKKNGLAWSHTVLIPRESDYDEGIEEIERALVELLEDVIEDEVLAESVELIEDEEEDEEDEEEGE